VTNELSTSQPAFDIVEAVALSIDTGHLNGRLPAAADEWEFDEVAWKTETAGEICIRGYRDASQDDGVEIVLQVKRIEYGPHVLRFGADEGCREQPAGVLVDEVRKIAATLTSPAQVGTLLYAADRIAEQEASA